jgi:hypothetical protein
MAEFTDREWAALDLLARSERPWIERSLADLIAGRAVVDGLVERKCVQVWTTQAVVEREQLYRKEKKAGKTREVPDGWRDTRKSPRTFVALTALGQTITDRDIFERSDLGTPYQGARRKDERGAWTFPDTPVRSLGSTGQAVFADMLPDEAGKGARPKRGSRAG